MPDWKTDLENELQKAWQARASGNEGQARVCARRAAGIALREYHHRRGQKLPAPGAYALLLDFAQACDTPADLRQIAEHLTLRVTDEFRLPLEVDLVDEARLFCERLLPGEPA